MGWKLSNSTICVLLAVIVGYLFFTKPKIGCVRMADVISEYEGMKEAIEKYQGQQKEWDTNLKVLEKRFNDKKFTYVRDSLQMSDAEKTTSKNELSKLYSEFTGYYDAVSEKATEEDQKATGIVLKKVNKFIDKYGKDNGYSVILGTLESGNIMYADKGYDVTEEIIEQLNIEYSGE